MNSPQTGPEMTVPLTQKLSPVARSVRMDDIRAAIRWLALLILPIIVSAISALVISQFIPPIYGARTDLILHLQQSGDAVERYLARYFAGFDGDLPPPGLYHRILREVEGPLVSAALTATRGNQIRAADLLGVNRNTLRKKIRDLDIQIYRTGSG